jgi:hypothetical protein
MDNAARNRARPENWILSHRFEHQAVSGHAAIPENSANHPFVRGHGPFSKRRSAPPPAAKMVQIQAAT